MKILFFLCLVTGLALANTDKTLYEQPYAFDNIAECVFFHFPKYAAADNFTFTDSATIRSIRYWTVSMDGRSLCNIDVAICKDNSGELGDIVWEDTILVADQTLFDTGDDIAGLDIYMNTLQINTAPNIQAGNYWLIFKADQNSGFVGWLVTNPTYPPNMQAYKRDAGWSKAPYDAFFCLYDENTTSLSKTTWTSIKNIF